MSPRTRQEAIQEKPSSVVNSKPSYRVLRSTLLVAATSSSINEAMGYQFLDGSRQRPIGKAKSAHVTVRSLQVPIVVWLGKLPCQELQQRAR